MKTIREMFIYLGIIEYFSAMRTVMIHDCYILTGSSTSEKLETVSGVDVVSISYDEKILKQVITVFKMGIIAERLNLQ